MSYTGKPSRGLVICVPPEKGEVDETATLPGVPQPPYVRVENWHDYPVFITVNATGQEVEIKPGGEPQPFHGYALHSVAIRGGKSPRRGLMRFGRGEA